MPQSGTSFSPPMRSLVLWKSAQPSACAASKIQTLCPSRLLNWQLRMNVNSPSPNAKRSWPDARSSTLKTSDLQTTANVACHLASALGTTHTNARA
eukprot:5656929-Pleurochrysis_carterae.AAC.1